MTTASEVKTCRQHPLGCKPFDRHPHSLRVSDELIAAVAAKVEAMEKATGKRLDKNAGLEMALEEWVGWREPGEPWKGPRRQAPGERKRPSANPGSAVFLEPGGKRAVAAVPDRKTRRQA